jgi:hypothetical protein
MQLMSKLRTARFLSLLTATAIMVPYLATGASAAKAQSKPAPKMVLAFPLDNPAGDGGQVASSLNESVNSAMESSGMYRVVSYSEELPGIDRLIRMQPEKKASLSGPFSGDPSAVANAVAIGKELSAELVLVGSLDKYSVSDKGVATVVATLELVDVQTGKVLKVAQASGISNEQAGAPSLATVQAVREVSRKLVMGLIGFDYQKPEVAQSTKSAKKHSNKTVWIAAILVGVGVGLLCSHHSSSSSGVDGPPGLAGM